jgi:hypothetical protein
MKVASEELIDLAREGEKAGHARDGNRLVGLSCPPAGDTVFVTGLIRVHSQFSVIADGAGQAAFLDHAGDGADGFHSPTLCGGAALRSA